MYDQSGKTALNPKLCLDNANLQATTKVIQHFALSRYYFATKSPFMLTFLHLKMHSFLYSNENLAN